MSLKTSPVEARQAVREDVDFRTQIIVQERAPVRAHLVNISALGCMIRCGVPAAPGMSITLILPEVGLVHGHIVWTKIDRIGVAFDAMIELDAYKALLACLNRQ